MMLCMARAYVEGYNPDIKLSQKQLIKMVHQIQPNEPLPKKIDSYDIKPCDDFSGRGIISIFYQLGD
ncbi:hypothetical protein A3Q24_05645 [Lactobacillus johnsonii]|uniref:Uncharacterized protein n=2 Tax=Lactobacillus johnsonii TaxID=33959 RepID=A0A267M6T0_LACJH|nr:hypothetical protein A3Q24_05645 [Lactobacillus johnsonii]